MISFILMTGVMLVEHLMPFSLSSVNISLGPGQYFGFAGSFPKNLGSMVNVLNPYWKKQSAQAYLANTPPPVPVSYLKVDINV